MTVDEVITVQLSAIVPMTVPPVALEPVSQLAACAATVVVAATLGGPAVDVARSSKL